MYHRKIDLVDSVKDKETNMFWDYLNNNYVHKYTATKKNKNIFKNIQKLAINDKYYINEIVLNGIKRKPYLDLETVYANKKIFNTNYKKIINKLQSDIIKVFTDQYNVRIKKSDILLLDSSGKVSDGYKFSLHIIVSTFFIFSLKPAFNLIKFNPFIPFWSIPQFHPALRFRMLLINDTFFKNESKAFTFKKC